MIISSQSNPALRRIRKLRHRREREQSGLFYAEGIRIVAEAIQVGAVLDTLVVAPELLESAFARRLVDEGCAAGTPVLEVTKTVFASISDKDGPQGLGAVIRQRWDSPETAGQAPVQRWVALSAVQDPGNLGTILRTSDAVGWAGVLLLGPTTDPYDPTCVRASMGAVLSQRLVRMSVAELAIWKSQYRHMVVGTSRAAASDYRRVAYRDPLIVYMGSERQGLSPDEQALCDLMVGIPMVGRADSLNLAVATAVVLYEAFHQLGGHT